MAGAHLPTVALRIKCSGWKPSTRWAPGSVDRFDRFDRFDRRFDLSRDARLRRHQSNQSKRVLPGAAVGKDLNCCFRAHAVRVVSFFNALLQHASCDPGCVSVFHPTLPCLYGMRLLGLASYVYLRDTAASSGIILETARYCHET